MGFDRAAEELYQSAAEAVRAPETSASDAAIVATSQQPSLQDSAEPTQAPQPKITKRVNARLQLAAALIEADNDRILEKAQFWHISHPQRPDDDLRPPPPPEPALASQSAIFAPYREGASLAVKRHVRTWSAATGLSRLLEPSDDGRRPSVDFLGVALPTEKRARSRAGSNASALAIAERPRSRADSIFSNAATSVLGRTSRVGSRPGSVLDVARDDDALSDAEVLSEWGVDKFLSREERDRLAAGQHTRTQSLTGGVAASSSLDNAAAASIPARKSLDAIRFPPNHTADVKRASSDIGTAPVTTPIPPATADVKLELLAKIKLYRERQENLPPSEWSGPGPTATKDQVVEHIIASSDNNKRASLREASEVLSQDQPPPAADGATASHQHRDQSAGVLATSAIHPPRPSSRADSNASSAFLGATGPVEPVNGIDAPSALTATGTTEVRETVEQEPSLAQTDADAAQAPRSLPAAPSQAIPIPQNSEAAGSKLPAQDSIAADIDMVGVGSYSRSQSRRNSFLGGPMFNPHGQTAIAFDQLESSSALPQRGSQPIAPSPLGHAKGPSRSWSQDLFAEHDLGLGPSPFAAALQAASPTLGPVPDASMLDIAAGRGPSPAIDFNSLTTRQLQAVARNSTFPSHLGINRDLLAEEELVQDAHLDQDEFGQLRKAKARPISYDFSALAQDLAKTGGENFEIQLGGPVAPDLSSANWGKPRKKWFRLSMMMDAKGKPAKPKSASHRDGDEGDAESDAEILSAPVAPVDQAVQNGETETAPNLSDMYAAEPAAKMAADTADAQEEDEGDVDDDYISPPRRGPLKPRGLAARMPKTLVMPQPLQGTEFAPKLRLVDPPNASVPAAHENKRQSLHVPDGFVLHDARGGLPPMRSLVVHSASGPQPMFVAKPKNKKSEQVSARLKAVEVGRTVQVPAAAPRGVGRRAAVPTTALFRNHLVQHDDEREGWGWEAGTRVDDMLNPDKTDDSDDDDKPLADIKKQGRSAKRAAKRLAKAKRKRKAARRVRREKREQALKEGKSFQEVGVEELSPDEDLDLSSTTSEEDETETDTDSDLWASDDDKRWVDDNKPAGKLYGKSLLDLATERNVERKSKARFYGQVQLEGGETTMLQIDGEDDTASQRPNGAAAGAASVYDDGASVALSVAKSFRDKPIGYNDTRERMEAVFGADQIWAREMAKRQEEEAREAEAARAQAEAEAAARQQLEAQAQAKPKKERSLFTLTKKNKKQRANLDVSNPSAMGSTASLAASNAEAISVTSSKRDAATDQLGNSADDPERSLTPVEPPVLALDIGDADDAGEEGVRGRMTPSLLAGEQKAAEEWLIASDNEDGEGKQDSSDDDDVPLAQVKKNVASASSFPRCWLVAEAQWIWQRRLVRRRVAAGCAQGEADSTVDAVGWWQARLGLHVDAGQPDREMEPVLYRRRQPRRFGLPAQGGLQVQEPRSRKRTMTRMRICRWDSDTLAETRRLRPCAWRWRRRSGTRRRRGRPKRRSRELPSWHAQVSTGDGDEEDGEQVQTGAKEDESGDDDDDDDSEDDKPLGYVHPQAAIIAEQAALIRQLQMEKEQAAATCGRLAVWFGFASPSGLDVRLVDDVQPAERDAQHGQ
ncbi:hypothetical protein L1887_47905 [Cichorium endivia]|nr:hypothetical protein L1887_47905 [Cichorium endivia]